MGCGGFHQLGGLESNRSVVGGLVRLCIAGSKRGIGIDIQVRNLKFKTVHKWADILFKEFFFLCCLEYEKEFSLGLGLIEFIDLNLEQESGITNLGDVPVRFKEDRITCVIEILGCVYGDGGDVNEFSWRLCR